VHAVELLTDLVGRTVSRVRRILYVMPDGTINGDRGDLELTTDDGVRVLGVGADGEEFVVRPGAWEDAFAEPLTPENAAFIRRSGKWVAFDLSTTPPFSALVGRITAVDPISRDGRITGAAVATDVGGRVEVNCDGDETWVTFPPD
jgi:hypothetical protein